MRRPQRQKLIAKTREVQELRRSNAAQPHRNKTRYTRKSKYKNWE